MGSQQKATGQAEASCHPEEKGPNDSSMPHAASEDRAEGHSQLHDSKGQTKLLQLLTTKSNQMQPFTLARLFCQIQTRTTEVASQGPGPCMVPRSRRSVKILHRVLQDGSSLVDLAKLTAEATGKELSQESSSTAPGSEVTVKQEPASPKKKENATTALFARQR